MKKKLSLCAQNQLGSGMEVGRKGKARRKILCNSVLYKIWMLFVEQQGLQIGIHWYHPSVLGGFVITTVS